MLRFPRPYLSLLPLLLLSAAADTPQPLQRIAQWQKSPESCRRAELLDYLRDDNLRVRSAALDLLEAVTGRDFGLDPWLKPDEVPASVQQQLAAWAAAEAGLGAAGQPPDEEQVRHAVALLRDADPDTLRRTCLRFAEHTTTLIAALRRELSGEQTLSESERDHLLLALYRIQLQAALGDDAGRAAGLLASHARSDQLDGLEMLRKAGASALPVVACFIDAEDGLLREMAVDIFLQMGKTKAFHHLLPALETETDRNILQIAARRALDCHATKEMIAFLNRCACHADEDVSVAALEALRELRGAEPDEDGSYVIYSRSQDGERLGFTMAGRGEAMPAESYVALTRSPYWRVRAAAVGLMESKSVFLPSTANKAVADAILAALEDEDETVRRTALRAMYRRGLSQAEALEAYTLRHPAGAAFAVYLLARREQPLSEGMSELIRRFSPAQVDELFAYADEYDDIFDERVPRACARRVVELLWENPDPAVVERLMAHHADALFAASPEKAARVMDWLESPDVMQEEKAGVISEMSYFLKDNERRWSRSKARLVPESPYAEVDARFLNWLRQQAEGEGEPAHNALMSLRHFDEERVAQVLTAKIAALGEGGHLHEDLVDHVTMERELLKKLPPEVLMRLMQEESCNSYVIQALVASERGMELLRNGPISEHAWYHLVLSTLDSQCSQLTLIRSSKYEDGRDAAYALYGLEPWLVPLLDHFLRHDGAEQRRCEVAFLLLAYRNLLEYDEVARSLAPFEYAAQLLAARDADYARCLAELPRAAEEVADWAERYAGSSSPYARHAVAGCLLPCSRVRFLFPLPKASDEGALSAPCSLVAMSALKRISCPRSLLERVRAMQHDEDAQVATVACASMLYRTGNCDRARFRELLLEHQRQWEEADEFVEYSRYSLLRRQLNAVWKRWSEDRSVVTEPFKLKGSPKKIPDELYPLLGLLHTVADESWSLPDEMREKVILLSAEGGTELPAQAGPALTFDAMEPAPALETPDSAAAEEEEPEPAQETQPPALDAPFRVEYFHRRGCDSCERVARELEQLRRDFPGMQVVDYAIESDAGYTRNDVLCSRFGVPAAHRHKAPILFTEAGFLMGEDIAGSSLRSLFESARLRGEERRLAASPQVKDDDAPVTPDTPAVTPKPAQPDMLAATTEAEAAAAETTEWWENLRRYGVLVLGGVVALAALLLVLFQSRRGRAQGDNEG